MNIPVFGMPLSVWRTLYKTARNEVDNPWSAVRPLSPFSRKLLIRRHVAQAVARIEEAWL